MTGVLAVPTFAPGDTVVVAGGGGFIGGHLVAAFRRQGITSIRAADIKPPGRWYQHFAGVQNVQADLRDPAACRDLVQGANWVFNLAADMGGMGFIETHKADCMLSVLINTNLLLAARDSAVSRYFFASSACVYNANKQDREDVRALREEDAYPAMPEDGYGVGEALRRAALPTLLRGLRAGHASRPLS